MDRQPTAAGCHAQGRSLLLPQPSSRRFEVDLYVQFVLDTQKTRQTLIFGCERTNVELDCL